MAWCLSTRASVATVLSMHQCISSSLWINICYITEKIVWIIYMYIGIFSHLPIIIIANILNLIKLNIVCKWLNFDRNINIYLTTDLILMWVCLALVCCHTICLLSVWISIASPHTKVSNDLHGQSQIISFIPQLVCQHCNLMYTCFRHSQFYKQTWIFNTTFPNIIHFGKQRNKSCFMPSHDNYTSHDSLGMWTCGQKKIAMEHPKHFVLLLHI